jgi:hypothetical protein
MRRLTINVYEWHELSQVAKEKATSDLCDDTNDSWAPIPCLILNAVSKKRLFRKNGALVK